MVNGSTDDIFALVIVLLLLVSWHLYWLSIVLSCQVSKHFMVNCHLSLDYAALGKFCIANGLGLFMYKRNPFPQTHEILIPPNFPKQVKMFLFLSPILTAVSS